MWVYTTDRRDRPVTGCLNLSKDSVFGTAIAMNCQKSIVDSILLCSNGRLLYSFPLEKDCLNSYNQNLSKNGKYSLEDDPEA